MIFPTMTFSRLRRVFAPALLSTLLGATSPWVHAINVEQDTLSHLRNMRAMQAGSSSTDTGRYNQQMDAAWRFFLSNKTQTIPLLAAQLQTELSLDKPNDLILLDIGLLLYKHGGTQEKALAIDALTRLNPEAAIVRANFIELFSLTFAVARDRNPRVLPIIEKAFLFSNPKFALPQRSLKLDGVTTCVLLYGAYGIEAEPMLRVKLADKAAAERVLEILIWTGTPAALPEVRALLAAQPGQNIFIRAVAYMMEAAGPAGREALLHLDSQALPPAQRDYLAKVMPAIKLTSFEAARATLRRNVGEPPPSAAAVAARVAQMLKDGGPDNGIDPLAIIDADLPAAPAIVDLTELRRRTFGRLSDDVLSEVKAISFMINALRYKAAQPGNPAPLK